jgi:uncharacterized protein (DUF2147 family)
MRNTLFVSFILLFFYNVTLAQNQIIGKWMSEDKKGITEIYKHNGKFYGKIVWLKTPKDVNGHPMADTKNPDPALKKRAIMGLIVLKDLHYQNNEWIDGTVYDPQTGKTYKCKISLLNNNTLKLKGFWGILSDTRLWSRVK